MNAKLHCEQLEIGPLALAGELGMPQQARSLVLCAQGGGCGLGRRHRALAQVLQGHRLATLQISLRCSHEAGARREALDRARLAVRLVQALDWVATQAPLAGLRLGLFGAGLDATPVLQAAAARPGRVGAVVSCGGRHDMAAAELARISAPTLLVVGGVHPDGLERHRQTWRGLRCNKRLEVIPGVTHLLDEPGTLGAVAELAAAWFGAHLAREH